MKIVRETLIKASVTEGENTYTQTFAVNDYQSGQELRKAIEDWGAQYGAKLDP